jgi:dTDP-glucose pyrophosphorylase
MSQTVKLVERHAADQPVAFGMPDTWFDDDQAFVKLAAAISAGADVAVGVFRVRPGQHQRGGMVDLDGDTVRDVIDKPESSGLAWIWGALAWRPAFWPLIDPLTPHVGYAIPRAIRAGLTVRGVQLRGPYFDCGTPDEYFDCIAHARARMAHSAA